MTSRSACSDGCRTTSTLNHDIALTVTSATIQAHAGPDGIRFALAVWLITARRGEAPYA